MRVIRPSFCFESEVDGYKMIKAIERYGRVCYKSEKRITDDSALGFLRRLLASGHESVIEHEIITVRVICDRGVSHEIVRHRIASYSQESTRYCNYTKDEFGKELCFIKPVFWEDGTHEYGIWKTTMELCERSYFHLIDAGASPQEARAVLPNSLKTEIIITMNLREWRHFFKLRTSEKAHPQMREISSIMLCEFQKRIPVLFEDIQIPM